MEWLLLIVLGNGVAMERFDTKRDCQVIALTAKEIHRDTQFRCIKLKPVKGAKTSF